MHLVCACACVNVDFIELALTIASLIFTLVFVFILLFVLICFRSEIRDLMNVLVLASQVQQGQIMHEGLSRLKYGPPHFVKALFTLAMQAQAHKCDPLNCS